MMTPAEILEAFAEKGLLIHEPSEPDAGRLAVTECTGAKLSPADAATIRKHKPALLAYLERERRAYGWLDVQPRPRRAAIARAAGAIRRKGTMPSDAWLEAIEGARDRDGGPSEQHTPRQVTPGAKDAPIPHSPASRHNTGSHKLAHS